MAFDEKKFYGHVWIPVEGKAYEVCKYDGVKRKPEHEYTESVVRRQMARATGKDPEAVDGDGRNDQVGGTL